jgi:hypothetical protein
VRQRVLAAYDPEKDRERKIRRELRRRDAVATSGATFTVDDWRALIAAYQGRCA